MLRAVARGTHSPGYARDGPPRFAVSGILPVLVGSRPARPAYPLPLDIPPTDGPISGVRRFRQCVRCAGPVGLLFLCGCPRGPLTINAQVTVTADLSLEREPTELPCASGVVVPLSEERLGP